jgi:hypothetical protein
LTSEVSDGVHHVHHRLLTGGNPKALGHRTAFAKAAFMRAHRRPINPLEVAERGRELAEAKLADFIDRVLDGTDLTEEARARLAEQLMSR